MSTRVAVVEASATGIASVGTLASGGADRSIGVAASTIGAPPPPGAGVPPAPVDTEASPLMPADPLLPLLPPVAAGFELPPVPLVGGVVVDLLQAPAPAITTTHSVARS